MSAVEMFAVFVLVLTASFRGRPLEGCSLQLPEGYVGKLLYVY